MGLLVLWLFAPIGWAFDLDDVEELDQLDQAQTDNHLELAKQALNKLQVSQAEKLLKKAISLAPAGKGNAIREFEKTLAKAKSGLNSLKQAKSLAQQGDFSSARNAIAQAERQNLRLLSNAIAQARDQVDQEENSQSSYGSGGSSGGGADVSWAGIKFEPSCFLCFIKRVTLESSQSYISQKTSYNGSNVNEFNGRGIRHPIHFLVEFRDEGSCSGNFTPSGKKINIIIHIKPDCSIDFINEF